ARTNCCNLVTLDENRLIRPYIAAGAVDDPGPGNQGLLVHLRSSAGAAKIAETPTRERLFLGKGIHQDGSRSDTRMSSSHHLASVASEDEARMAFDQIMRLAWMLAAAQRRPSSRPVCPWTASRRRRSAAANAADRGRSTSARLCRRSPCRADQRGRRRPTKGIVDRS